MGRVPQGLVLDGEENGRTANSFASLLCDLAAGHSIGPGRPITDHELALAARHGLLGIMATSDDPFLANAARAPFTRLAGRQVVMEATLRRTLENLMEAGIRSTIVKGPALARWAYSDPRLRTYTDLDLLVPPDRVSDTLELLGTDPSVVTIPERTAKANKRNIHIQDPSGVGFTIDLHWDLFSYTQLRGCARGAIDHAWERAVWLPSHPLGPMWKLPDETLISFLATHAMLDHRFRLILFRDLAELARLGIDWESLFEFSRRYGLRAISYAAWTIAQRTVAAPIPASALNELRPRSAAIAALDRILARTDLVHFDGHRPHVLNLAVVLLHDIPSTRARLILAAPISFPKWLKRVKGRAFKRSRHPPRRRTEVRRVLHVLPVDIARGAQTYAKAMRDSLDGEEVQHRTATIFESQPVTLHADVDLGVNSGIGRRVGFSVAALVRLRNHIRSWNPDVVVAHGGEALKYSAFATPAPAKLVYYKIGTSSSSLHNPIRRWFYRKLISRADLVAAVSEDMVVEARELLGAPSYRTLYVPNGRDPAHFAKIAQPGGSGPVRFVFVGYLTRSKRPERFVDVIATLNHGGIEAEGLVIGEGPMYDEMTGQAPEGVTFVGRRADVPSLLANCDVLLFTSDTEGEGMPGVLIEAGLAGLPVVSTNVPGASTVIEDGVTGFIVGVNDGRAFVEAAERLARDPELRQAMGAAARQRCMEKFTLDSSTEVWRRRLARL